MLGHLKPRSCRIQPDVKQHYQRLYCSLCYSLRQQFGLSASFLISHELTLCLAAFSESAVLPVETCACPAKLFCQQKPVIHAPLIDRAAQLCLLLVWLKLIDSEVDRPAFYKRRLRQTIEQKVQPILARLSVDTQQFIEAYLVLIRADNSDFSVTAKMSGLLAKQVFQELSSDHTVSTVADITLLLGELITIADALLDLAQDSKQQQYNPIMVASQQNQTSLAEEYALLKANYDQLVEQITNKIVDGHLPATNAVFSALLQESLRNLTGKIQRSALKKRRNDTPSVNNYNCWADGCGGCFDCCQCCGENGSCCECSECPNCCECGGCDC